MKFGKISVLLFSTIIVCISFFGLFAYNQNDRNELLLKIHTKHHENIINLYTSQLRARYLNRLDQSAFLQLQNPDSVHHNNILHYTHSFFENIKHLDITVKLNDDSVYKTHSDYVFTNIVDPWYIKLCALIHKFICSLIPQFLQSKLLHCEKTQASFTEQSIGKYDTKIHNRIIDCHNNVIKDNIYYNIQSHLVEKLDLSDTIHYSGIQTFVMTKSIVFYHPILNTKLSIVIYSNISDIIHSSNLVQYKISAFVLSIFVFVTFIFIQYVRRMEYMANSEIYRSNFYAKEKESIRKDTKNQLLFLANLNHELRTPLNSIIGFSDLLLSTNNLNDLDRKEYTQHILTSGNYLLEIINDILDFYKLSLGKLRFDITRVHVPEIVDVSIQILHTQSIKSQIEINSSYNKENQYVLADGRRLQQCIINVVNNAIKFSKPNSCIKITTFLADDDQMCINIIDNGIGINEIDIPKVLEPFEQVDNAMNKQNIGTGLGLPLSKKLIENMDGQFRIYNRANINNIQNAEDRKYLVSLYNTSNDTEITGTIVQIILPCYKNNK